jgi:CRP/FNR family transcriptional regulator, cyclic AMP receptor protein
LKICSLLFVSDTLRFEIVLTSSKTSILRRIPLFAGLSDPEIDAIVDRAIEKRYSGGEALFREGEECRGLYLLAQGNVKISKASGSGREVMLAMETAPSSVAEVPLFDGGPYPATVTAIGPVVAYLLTKPDFNHICRLHGEVPLKVLAVVGQRLRTLVRVVESVTFGSVRQRLARSLLEFGEQARADSFVLPVTHEELAFRLGTVREVVSRNLSRFQAEGLLQLRKRDVTLLDRPGLEREAETEF